MRAQSEIAKDLRAALEREPRVNLHRTPIDITFEGDHVVLNGEVASIETKRAAAECAKAAAGTTPVADRLRVRPTARSSDAAIRDGVCHHLLQEPVFIRMAITSSLPKEPEILRRPDEAEGSLEVSVADGVVTLHGQVWIRSHKRLAAVLAWWTPGCRDVINSIDVEPPESDSDGEIRDAIELVLNKDPIVHSDQVTAQVRDGRVVLRGLVATGEERWMVEHDIWYIEGVRDVVNELDVYHGPAGREPLPATPPPFE